MHTQPIADSQAALRFLQGARSTATLRSNRTGRHFTFKISAPKGEKDSKVRFVSVLAGPDNTSNYRYVGMIRDGRLVPTRASKYSPAAQCFRAFDWALVALRKGNNTELDVFHHGRCCQCNRKLTHPESIETGVGPVCGGRE